MTVGNCSCLLSLLTALSLSAAGEILQEQELNREIGQLMSELEIRYFQKSHCVALVSEGPVQWLQYQKALDIVPHLLIFLSNKHTIREQILPVLDAACPVFVFQVADPKEVIQKFHKVTRYSIQRILRKFIFLPTLKGQSEVNVETEEKYYLEDFFSIREMEFMPDILYIRANIFSNLPKRNISVEYITDPETNLLLSNNYHRQVNDFLPISEKVLKMQRSKINENLYDVLHETHRVTIEVRSAGLLNRNNYSSYFTQASTIVPRLSNNKHFVVELQILSRQFQGLQPSQIVFLDSWTNGFLFDRNLLEDKLTNLQGKEIIVAALNYPPFVMIDLQANPPLIDGSEMRCVQEFGHKLNATFKYMDDQGTLWGEVQPNGSASGLIGFAIEGVADIMVSAHYYLYTVFVYANFAMPHSRSEATCIAPRPRLISRLLVPILPFPLEVWLAVGVSIIISVVSLYLVGKASSRRKGESNPGNNIYKSIPNTFLIVFGMLVLQTPSEQDKIAPLRHLVTWIMVFYLMVTTLYSSGLAANLTVPSYEPPIDTPTDLANSPFLWAANHDAWIISIQNGTDRTTRKLVKKFRVFSEHELTKRAEEGKTAFILERTIGGTFIPANHVTLKTMENLRAMKGSLYWNYMGVIMRKGSPYSEMFNLFILRLVQADLHDHWERYITKTMMSQRLQLAVSQSVSNPNSGPTNLQLDHAQGMFLILALGLIISAMVFFSEIRSVKPIPSKKSEKHKI